MASREWHRQKDFLRKNHNRYVNTYFRDVPEVDDSLTIGTTRKEAKYACLIKPKDSQNMALLKMQTFIHVIQKAHLEPKFWGLPLQTFIDTTKHKAQVIIQLREKKYEAYDNDRLPLSAQVSFRVMDEESWSSSEVNSLANRIKSDWATPPFSFYKGTTMYTYKDLKNGWNFQILADSETEAKSVIEKCFDTQNAGVPDWGEYLKTHTTEKNYVTAEYITVMGEQIRKPRRRPKGRVYFAWAELLIPGLPEPLTLCDVTGTRPRAITVA